MRRPVKMKKLSFILLLFFITQEASAETIELSDRSTIEARIIARSDRDITVNIDGVKMSYLLDEVLSVDGMPVEFSDSRTDAAIAKLLRSRGYPADAWPDIERELKKFLVSIDFYALKNKIGQARRDPQELRHYVAKLGRSIRQQGYLDIRNPKPLIRLLVNSLGDDNMLSAIDPSPLSACSVVSQLASIVLELSGIDARVAIAFEHVFNIIPLDGRQVIFADFSNEIFDIVDMDEFYRINGKYRVLKKEQRLAPKFVRYINDQWDKGHIPTTQRQILNLYIYFYFYMSDNNSATAIIYTNRGNDYALKGDYKKALVNYAQALKINPHIAGVYCNRGLVYAAIGDLNRAIFDYNRALEINPDDADTYNDRGLAFKNKNDLARAINDYNRALEINPNFYQIYINRAACYYYLKEYAKAREDVHQAQKLGYSVKPEFIHLLNTASDP
jgi:tetratricopeptide (TPR) repeat protein